MKNLKKFEAFSAIIPDDEFINAHKDKTVAELMEYGLSFDKICYLKNSINSDLNALVDLQKIYPNIVLINDKKKAAHYHVGQRESVFNLIPNGKSHSVLMNTMYSPNANIIEHLEQLGWIVEFMSKPKKSAVEKSAYYDVVMSKQTYLINFFATTSTNEVTTAISSLSKIIY